MQEFVGQKQIIICMIGIVNTCNLQPRRNTIQIYMSVMIPSYVPIILVIIFTYLFSIIEKYNRKIYKHAKNLIKNFLF